jgi:hypothetical protein
VTIDVDIQLKGRREVKVFHVHIEAKSLIAN